VNFWTPENFQQVTAGRWLHRPTDGTPLSELTGVSTDSRSLKPGEVFVALRGERFDGHEYLLDAEKSGSPLLLVDREDIDDAVMTSRNAVLYVEDTLKALARLASAYRRTLGARVIAITGSVGKTTTKTMLHAVLAQRYRGSASPKSFNNNIGVPLTLLAVKPGDHYVICEVGTNAPGEIASLARIVEPDIAIITHAGRAHLEKLGSIEDVAREKAALLSFLSDQGLAVVNGDIPPLLANAKVAPTLISFGRGEHCDLRLTECTPSERGVDFQVNRRFDFHLSLLGEHNALNALAVIAVARHMKLTDEQIASGLAAVSPPDMRLAVREIAVSDGPPLRLINDAYNANPESMEAALAVLLTMPTPSRRVAILGDMLELGSDSPLFHRSLGESLAEMRNIDLTILIGHLGFYTAEALFRTRSDEAVHPFSELTPEAMDAITALIQPGDTILLKGSRGIGLERLIPALEKRFDQTAPTQS
jgi:UDP-N-acetylmuramoyl-tripeptide--D-alanyl-D-alanine ligase